VTMPKKRKQKVVRGSIAQTELGDRTFAFGQVLKPPLIAFLDLRADSALPIEEIAGCKVVFSVWVMKYAVADGDWPVIGRADVPGNRDERPAFFKKDRISGSLSITYTGEEEAPATLEGIRDLECAAVWVWDPEHVVDRLNDHFAGKPNKWVESMRP